MKTVIQLVELLVQKQLEGEGTGHDWYHVDRVRNMALHIQSKEGGDVEIVEFAALLHDISDHKFNGGDFLKGGKIAKELLLSLNIDKDKVDRISSIVDNVSFKGSGVADNMTFLEGKIVQDADRLDAIGAIGIARTFAYGGSVGQPIYNPNIEPISHDSPEEYQKGRSHTINHFYEKLLLLKERMHTSTAKTIAKERTKFMEEYLDHFYNEWAFNRKSKE
ncbi:MAG: HD domain-containing protein [Brumimicrobium sp.]